MNVVPTPLEGMVILEPKSFGDHRGYFMETYNKKVFHELGLTEEFVQDNHSVSKRATLRGLHYQLDPHAQGKLVRVANGEVWDVGVDLRKSSPTFGKWYGETLSAENKKMLYVPPGFAHAFLALTDDAVFLYKCTDLYAPTADRVMRWDDPTIGIEWPIQPDLALMSEKDRNAPLLGEAEYNFK